MALLDENNPSFWNENTLKSANAKYVVAKPWQQIDSDRWVTFWSYWNKVN